MDGEVGKRYRVHINDDNTVRFIYLCTDKWPELYPEKVERTGHVYASTSGQDIGASTSGGRTVEDNEDGDEDGDEDKDEDKDEDADEDEDVGGVESSDDEYVPSDEDSDDDTDFESSSSVPYVFDDISGWDKTLEEVENDGIKMWDGNPLTLGLDIHFANKPEAQAAVGEWNLANIDMIQKCQTVLPPTPMKLYEEARKKSLRQRSTGLARETEVRSGYNKTDNQPWKADEKQVVLYANRECTCGRWQTFRFPCSHALRVARELGDDPFPLFDPCYTTHQWYQQFSGEFNPIMEPWPKATWQIRPDDTKLVHHAGRGRKRVNRKKGVMDYTSKSGQRRLQTCSLCKLQGHNARACPYARVCARCGSLDHDAVECPFSHPPADRTGIDKLYDPYGIHAYLERMFGFRFQTEESRLTSVSITEIKTHIENNPLTDLSPDDAHLQRARCFVGWLVGGLLFSNTTRNSFPLDLVHFLHTPEICSSTIGVVRHYVTCTAKHVQSSLAARQGYYRSGTGADFDGSPKILGGDLDLSDCPLGTRWSREKKVQGITRFNLARRDRLAVLAESDFVWMPYTTLLGRIAVVCLVGTGIWRSRTWLICGDVVAPHNPSRVFRQFGYHQRIPGDALLLTAAEITSLLKRKPFGGSDRRWLQQLGIYLQVWNDRHGQVVGTDDLYVGEPSADPEYLLWYHQVTVKYVTDPTDSENARGFHGSAETLRLMATLMEDVRSLSIIGQRTFDADSFGYDRLGEIAQVAERALSVNATNVVRHDLDRHVESSLDGQSIHYTSNFLSSMFEVLRSSISDNPAEGERESQGEDDAEDEAEDEDEDEAEDADQDDQFEGQGYQRHEEQGSSRL
ncbi:OLC1v1012635C1 [Oldenlandia corymbosa var. corymbosa]|uniref:OLC1v1012635C1 n=1 Tax=Oldenlandia corymbosa var. corymbosa TaxID=529605 RepID=A0AAV1DWK4_OLDCO|nr:OLC1v1012635C1 [Oldenlandia corymbosa var. corymbosa]